MQADQTIKASPFQAARRLPTEMSLNWRDEPNTLPLTPVDQDGTLYLELTTAQKLTLFGPKYPSQLFVQIKTAPKTDPPAPIFTPTLDDNLD